MARYTKEEQAGFAGLNGGTETCMQRLIEHVGVTRLPRFLESLDAMIADENFPDALRKQLRIFRLTCSQLHVASLEGPCRAYKRANSALETTVRQRERLRESIERNERLWKDAADGTRKAFQALQTLDVEWDAAFTQRALGLPKLLVTRTQFMLPLDIVPTEIEAFRQCRPKLTAERERIFGALNEHLATHDSYEGLAEMEALDEALRQMDRLASAHEQHVAAIFRIPPALDKASQHLRDAYKDVAIQIWTLPLAGQISLVRLLRLLFDESYERYRAKFEWLLKRPVPQKDIAKEARVTVIHDGKSFERPLAEPTL